MEGRKLSKETRQKMSASKNKYKRRYVQELREYFRSYQEPGIPTLSKFARMIGVTSRTMENWAHLYQEFRDAVEDAMEIQRDLIADKGLIGEFNPQMSKFLLSANHGMSDKPEADIGAAAPLEVSFRYRDGMKVPAAKSAVTMIQDHTGDGGAG